MALTKADFFTSLADLCDGQEPFPLIELMKQPKTSSSSETSPPQKNALESFLLTFHTKDWTKNWTMLSQIVTQITPESIARSGQLDWICLSIELSMKIIHVALGLDLESHEDVQIFPLLVHLHNLLLHLHDRRFGHCQELIARYVYIYIYSSIFRYIHRYSDIFIGYSYIDIDIHTSFILAYSNIHIHIHSHIFLLPYWNIHIYEYIYIQIVTDSH